MRPSATRAATRAGEALPFLKNISTHQTLKRKDNELFSLGRCGACNMRKMLIDLFFSDSDRLGEFPGAHLLFTQEDDHLLTNRLHVIPMFLLLHLGDCSMTQTQLDCIENPIFWTGYTGCSGKNIKNSVTRVNPVKKDNPGVKANPNHVKTAIFCSSNFRHFRHFKL